MEYAFLTTLIPTQLDSEVRTRSKSNMQDAANALQWNIYEGLSRNLDKKIMLFNALPIGSFPQYYNLPFIKRSLFDTAFGGGNVNIGFCNIKLLRKFIQPMKIYRELEEWCKKSNEPKTLFVYTVSAPFMSAVAKLKCKFPDVKICAVIADLPDMSSLSSNKSALKKLFEKYLANSSYSNISCVDAFVLLTEQMAEYIKTDKPFTVMEGIASDSQLGEPSYESDKKTVLYTGTLHKKFGILNLINAFGLIDGDDYKLTICGLGDSEEEIIAAAKRDKRIEFKGQLTRSEVLELQRQATVLVNPRQNNEVFTKYSFPSKTMEYLASGVPVVAYKLDGIPDEYDEYIKYVPNDLTETLAKTLQEVCELSAEERRRIGEKARKFVLEEKTAVSQTKKIIEFIKEI